MANIIFNMLHNVVVKCSYNFLSKLYKISLNLLKNLTKPGYELV